MTSVPEVTFSGSQALRRGQIVRYITERCVFELTAEGLELLEVAPGVELQRDILDQMDFAPIVRNVRPMDAAIFRPERMRLLERHFKLDLADRMHYSEHNNTMYIDLQNVSINSMQDLDRMAAQVLLCPPSHRTSGALEVFFFVFFFGYFDLMFNDNFGVLA